MTVFATVAVMRGLCEGEGDGDGDGSPLRL